MHAFDQRKATIDSNGNLICEKPKSKMYDDSGYFHGAQVVVDNLIARATTKWTLNESKLFLCAVSKIATIDVNHTVKIPKRDLKLMLDEADDQPSPWLRKLAKSVMEKSFVCFNGPRADLWDAGFLVTRARTDKKNVFITFNSAYMPLLQHLSEHFTKFSLDDILSFRRKSSLNLYLYLCSWWTSKHAYHNQDLRKRDLPIIFNLPEGAYWRDYGKENARFDWALFESRVLGPAIDEINTLTRKRKCDMLIQIPPDDAETENGHPWEKVKKGKMVMGYTLYYIFIDKKDGSLAWIDSAGKLTSDYTKKPSESADEDTDDDLPF